MKELGMRIPTRPSCLAGVSEMNEPALLLQQGSDLFNKSIKKTGVNKCYVEAFGIATLHLFKLFLLFLFTQPSQVLSYTHFKPYNLICDKQQLLNLFVGNVFE